MNFATAQGTQNGILHNMSPVSGLVNRLEVLIPYVELQSPYSERQCHARHTPQTSAGYVNIGPWAGGGEFSFLTTVTVTIFVYGVSGHSFTDSHVVVHGQCV